MSHTRTRALSIGAVTLALALAATSAQAHGGHRPGPSEPTTVASGLVTPLKVAVDLDGTTYVTQNFAGLLTTIPRHGDPTVVASVERPGTELGAVSAFAGTVTFAESWSSEEDPDDFTAVLRRMSRSGAVSTVADLEAAERRYNPDGANTYGFQGLDDSCEIPEHIPQGAGTVYSHPYATISALGYTIVADAGANALWKVDRHGKVRPLVVLPPQTATLSDEALAGLGAPECAYGHAYAFEPVPTDVELGPDGWLYVTTLPGGPEDPSFGARGSVYKVNPWTGQTRLVASNLAAAVDLAVSPRGDVYVAELFGSGVTVVTRGSHTAKPLVDLPMPGAVEWTPRGLVITTDVLSETGGNLVTVPLR
ncbi:ScyD/ScyE family protein [Cellulomonas sp. DKR-3]|uniref:ScyD/ScyE family protein n=1 Tax=Cellulomonas fulva TaxID=2835530 RepID=A0ABS5TY57_9CELL|nr:ScyD/ScyE family protein [Cellulomonas fulva]MBT0994091.1 ScyD/ScyE family protein [Cellulomonas fulva]